MSYDFAVLTPEAAGATAEEVLEAAAALFQQQGSVPAPDPRL